MSRYIILIGKSLGIAGLAFLFVNFLAFGVAVFRQGLDTIQHIQYDLGTFYIDGRATGFVLGTTPGRVFFTLVIITALVFVLRRHKVRRDDFLSPTGD